MAGFNGVIPTEYKVLIRPEKVEDQSSGGIFLPDTSRDREQYGVDRGIVLAYGEGFFKDLPGPVPQVGDKVIFNKHAGTLIDIMEDGIRNKCRLISDKDVCAIIKEE